MAKRDDRLAAIREIVRTTEVRTQAELAKLVAAAGFECTQATISRDIADLHLEKRRGSKSFMLPEEVQIERMITQVACAGNMIVAHTRAGAAQGLAAVLDNAGLRDILGSVAGDDTVMMVAKTEEAAQHVTAYLAAHCGA